MGPGRAPPPRVSPVRPTRLVTRNYTGPVGESHFEGVELDPSEAGVPFAEGAGRSGRAP
jgi:hypothetical protein